MGNLLESEPIASAVSEPATVPRGANYVVAQDFAGCRSRTQSPGPASGSTKTQAAIESLRRRNGLFSAAYQDVRNREPFPQDVPVFPSLIQDSSQSSMLSRIEQFRRRVLDEPGLQTSPQMRSNWRSSSVAHQAR